MKNNSLAPVLILILALAIGIGTKIKAHKLSYVEKPSDNAKVSVIAYPNSDVQKEYATISITGSSSVTWVLTGLSLLQNNFAARVPKAVKVFMRGEIADERLVLSPLPTIFIINSGRSPVGVSFQVNKCSGFLGEYQTFVPPFEKSCPTINEILAKQNVPAGAVSADCTKFFDAMPRCSALPESTPAECKSVLAEHAQYNQCVESFKNDADFNKPEWRLYLGSENSLWATTSPIKLLDYDGEIIGSSEK